MERIIVIGSGGAGKSTLSRQLGQLLGIEVYHLDSLHWKPGWVETPDSEWKAVQEELVKKNRFIIDGNYGASLGMRMEVADTILFLDFPRVLCIWRAVTRMLKYWGRTRPDMGPECPEHFELDFFKWIWNYPGKTRPKVLKMLEQYRDAKTVVIFKSPRDVRKFVDKVRSRGT